MFYYGSKCVWSELGTSWNYVKNWYFEKGERTVGFIKQLSDKL